MRIFKSECRVSGSDDKNSLNKIQAKKTCDKTKSASNTMRIACFLAWSAVCPNLMLMLMNACKVAMAMPVIIVTSIVLNVIWCAAIYWMMRIKWPNN